MLIENGGTDDINTKDHFMFTVFESVKCLNHRKEKLHLLLWQIMNRFRKETMKGLPILLTVNLYLACTIDKLVITASFRLVTSVFL